MIFKTFDSDIDNMSSRWGMFGKSFSDIGDTITTKWKQVTDYVAVTNDATISGMMSAWKGTSPVQFLSDDSVVNVLNDYNSLREIADEALNTKVSLKNALSDIQKSCDVMYEFKDAMSDNGITDSLLNSVASHLLDSDAHGYATKIQNAYDNAKKYVDQSIADLIGGASSTADTLGEIEKLMKENSDVVDALDKTIGSKASQDDLSSHVGDSTIHITDLERENWNDANSKKHEHSNYSVLENITSTIVNSWNNAVKHISDTVKHITSTERDLTYHPVANLE